MSDLKIPELQLRGGTHSHKHKDLFPEGPDYPVPICDLQGMLRGINAGNIIRYSNELLMERVVRKLAKQPGTMHRPSPRMRLAPRTEPKRHWFVGISWYFQNAAGLTGHFAVLMPAVNDYTLADGSCTSQHIVMFSNTTDYALQSEAAQAFLNAFVESNNFTEAE